MKKIVEEACYIHPWMVAAKPPWADNTKMPPISPSIHGGGFWGINSEFRIPNLFNQHHLSSLIKSFGLHSIKIDSATHAPAIFV